MALMSSSDEDVELVECARVEMSELVALRDDNLAKLLGEFYRSLSVEKAAIEIKACAGGKEAGTFIDDIVEYFTSYSRFINSTLRVVKSSPTFTLLDVEGRGSRSLFIPTSGIHRLQRVPSNDPHERMHTSTISIAILDKEEASDDEMEPGEVRFEFARSSGPGGQNANMANSCVRAIDCKTGMSSVCQRYRSPSENKEEALKILRSKIASHVLSMRRNESNATRKGQVKGGQRSEKIVTYNFPRDQVIFHLKDVAFSGIKKFLRGDYLEEVSSMYLLHLFGHSNM